MQRTAARELLAPSYAWFTEGFDTGPHLISTYDLATAVMTLAVSGMQT